MLQLAASRDAVEAVNVLMDSGSLKDINATNAVGETALHTACQHGLHTLEALLADSRLDVNVENGEGNSPLHMLALRGDGVEAIKLLLAHRADPNRKNKKGNTPLHIAAALGLVDTVRTLISAGASPSTENDDGLTPADMSSQNEVLDCLKL